MDWAYIGGRVIVGYEYGVITFALAINSIYFALMVIGFFVLKRDRDVLSESEREALLKSPLLPRVSVLAPAYNESATCRDSVRAMLNLQYPNVEIIVINDGSKDDTLQVLVEEFRLCKCTRAITGNIETKPIRNIYRSRDPIPLIVVDKVNGGKADALNVGLNVARDGLVAAVDADSLLDPDSLLAVVKPFVADPERTVATSGSIRTVNGCSVSNGRVTEIKTSDSLIVRYQTVEYLRAFLGSRVGLGFMNSLMVISGAFGVFRRDKVLEVGGYLESTVGEDMELIVRLHRHCRERGQDYRICFLPNPVCWTEVPEDLKILKRQRMRWQRGAYETLLLHRHLFFRPKYGAVGMFGAPYFALFEMLGPVVELTGYVVTALGFLLGVIWIELALMFTASSVLYGMFLSAGAVALEEATVRRYPSFRDGRRLYWAAILENLGYRQLTVLWRTRGLIDAIRGKRGNWGAMVRKGFQPASS